MDTQFDGWTKQLGADVPRRQVVLGLGSLALGSAAYLAGRQAVAADEEADVTAEGCHRRCRRRCKGRKPRCKERCIRRLGCGPS